MGGEAESCPVHGGWQSRNSGETTTSFALPSSAPPRSELQGFQGRHTRCKMGTGPAQMRAPSHLHRCEQQNARLRKPMSWEPIPRAVSTRSEYTTVGRGACALHPAVSLGSSGELLSVQMVAGNTRASVIPLSATDETEE